MTRLRGFSTGDRFRRRSRFFSHQLRELVTVLASSIAARVTASCVVTDPAPGQLPLVTASELQDSIAIAAPKYIILVVPSSHHHPDKEIRSAQTSIDFLLCRYVRLRKRAETAHGERQASVTDQRH